MAMQTEEGMVGARTVRQDEAITHNGHGVGDCNPIVGRQIGRGFHLIQFLLTLASSLAKQNGRIGALVHTTPENTRILT